MGTSVQAEKHLTEVVRERRATDHFGAEPVAPEDLDKILGAGLEAPSGYNLQPWRFVVVMGEAERKALQAAAMRQPKVAEAPVVVVACGDAEGWKNGDLDEMLRLAAEHGYGGPEQHAQVRKAVTSFLENPGDAGGLSDGLTVWVNRHVMIAFTYMMLAAEALGYDTAPMEGFHESKVREALGIPPHVHVVALLAIGRRSGDDKPYGGRFAREKTVFFNRWGER